MRTPRHARLVDGKGELKDKLSKDERQYEKLMVELAETIGQCLTADEVNERLKEATPELKQEILWRAIYKDEEQLTQYEVASKRVRQHSQMLQHIANTGATGLPF